MNRDQLLREIRARRPWYQRVEFPEFGVSTTDDPENSLQDGAPDNQIDGVGPEEAARLRPLPKWRYIEAALPNLEGLEVLEVGSNCGFFSFQFAARGGRRVVGIDVAPKWVENALWCRDVLRCEQVSFHNCDFMNLGDDFEAPPEGLLQTRDAQIPLPNHRFDLIFMSTVLGHTFFPFLTIYKMLRMSRKWVVIDSPILQATADDEATLRQSYAPDGIHHGTVLSRHLLFMTMCRLGIPKKDIRMHVYNEGKSMTLVVATDRMASGLRGA